MKKLCRITVIALVALYVERGLSIEVEKQAAALAKALGGTKGIKRKKVSLSGSGLDRAVASTDEAEVYAMKDGTTVKKIAVVQKRVYEPNCTHTWVIGLNGKSLKVEQIRVVEMSCPHAFPCKEPSFLDQYKGVGPAEIKKLKGKFDTIAKATGTSNLTTDAVTTAIAAAKIYLSDEG